MVAKKTQTKKKASRASSAGSKAAKKRPVKQSKGSSARPSSKRTGAARVGATPSSGKRTASARAASVGNEHPKQGVASTKKSSAGQSIGAEGSKLPAFALRDQNGNTVTAAGLRGAPFVLYFYPKDDTPGCTKEACDFRDQRAAFDALGCRVIGVSPDSEKSHQKFANKYGLDFTLLSDPDKELSTALGVWQLKSNYGREYMGVVRSTFLVDARGVIARAWRGVKVAGHIPAVAQGLRELLAGPASGAAR